MVASSLSRRPRSGPLCSSRWRFSAYFDELNLNTPVLATFAGVVAMKRLVRAFTDREHTQHSNAERW